MVISELLPRVTKSLSEGGIENSRFEAGYLIGYVLNMPQAELILNADISVSADDEEKISALVKRRISGEPFQYILGTQEFMGLEFAVTGDVLIPRQDTETLVEFILENTDDRPLSVLDIGTGTGCIPISLAHFKTRFNCLGIDINENAIALAQKNSETFNVSDRVKFEICDILKDFPKRKFDVVVSNPPYIKSSVLPLLQAEVRDFEPHQALDGGTDGLKFYRRICDIASDILKIGGLLAFEIGFDQADEVVALMKKSFENIKVTKDLSQNNRVVSGYLR